MKKENNMRKEQKSNKERGITLIALIITIILMLILASIVIKFSGEAIDKAKLEDLKTNMLLLQVRAKTIYEKYSFKEIDALVGIAYNPNNEASQDIGYIINDNLNTKLAKQEGMYYIWQQQDFDNNGIGTIKVDSEKFYIVDYKTGEIYYSIGYKKDGITYYSLTDLQSL